MNPPVIALPVRAGEYACCRFARREDRERLTIAFVRAGLQRGHKVIFLHDYDDPEGFLDLLRAAEDATATALADRQLELRPARPLRNRPARPLEMARDEHRQALAAGFDGLAITAVVTTSAPPTRSHVLMCQYPRGFLPPARLSEPGTCPDVDASPELAPIGRESAVSAARVRDGDALRFAGQLDFEGAPAVADVLAAHFAGPLRVDLADVSVVDVAGMRALRGRAGQRLIIDHASEAVTRLAVLLAWDTDPDVDLPLAG